MAAHARLKYEFTEDEKYHHLMSWLISLTKSVCLPSLLSDKTHMHFQRFLWNVCLSVLSFSIAKNKILKFTEYMYIFWKAR